MSATYLLGTRSIVVSQATALLCAWQAARGHERLALVRELRHQARRLPGGSDRRSVLLALEWIDNDGRRIAA